MCDSPGSLEWGSGAWLANPSSLTYFNTNGRVSGLGKASWYVKGVMSFCWIWTKLPFNFRPRQPGSTPVNIPKRFHQNCIPCPTLACLYPLGKTISKDELFAMAIVMARIGMIVSDDLVPDWQQDILINHAYRAFPTDIKFSWNSYHGRLCNRPLRSAGSPPLLLPPPPSASSKGWPRDGILSNITDAPASVSCNIVCEENPLVTIISENSGSKSFILHQSGISQ